MNEFREKLLSQSVIGPRNRSRVLVDSKEKLVVRDENGHDTVSHESGRVDVNINVKEPVKGKIRTEFS